MRNKKSIKINTDETMPIPVGSYGPTNFEEESFGGITSPGTGHRGHGDDFVDFLIDLADLKDSEGNVSEANFIDLIIKKSSYIDKNYFNLLRTLLNKQYVENPNDIKLFGLNLYKIYSETYEKTNNSHTAARAAYNSLSKNNINKTAGTLEQDPIYVADSIVRVIKIMVSMISPEKRPDSFKNIKNKIFEEFDPAIISNKKSPGGAAIGVSLALIKNILNSRDQMFIRLVLDEVRKKIGY